jgi:hypothetical protein
LCPSSESYGHFGVLISDVSIIGKSDFDSLVANSVAIDDAIEAIELATQLEFAIAHEAVVRSGKVLAIAPTNIVTTSAVDCAGLR